VSFTIPEATRLAQQRASDPGASAWVSANAGSGKTTVLANRVIRLLLRGVAPGRILSITFTKAAAANMATRVFGVLSRWVTMSDVQLAQQLTELEGEPPGEERLAAARRLFARAIETPGGLKIQTIHAFCERLLHLFPFEANVAARFEVLDEASGAELLAEARRQVLVTAVRDGDGPLARAFALLNETLAEESFAEIVDRAVRLRSALGSRAHGLQAIGALAKELAGLLGLPPGATTEELDRRLMDEALPEQTWRAAVAAFRGYDKPRESGFADKLEEALRSADGERRREAYLAVFLTTEGKPRSDKAFVSKGFQSARPDLASALVEEKERIASLLEAMRGTAAVERTQALLTMADAVARLYDEAKSRRGALDFDDLIARTADLLGRKAEAAWVLYKLDQGIDHILIDEAQDTSEPQWAILRALAEDFVAGEGRSSVVRTLFAVGDPKQSIYSFQGAAPEAFEHARRDFKRRIGDLAAHGDAERWRFNDERLTLSFRSAGDVLAAVDAVFAPPEHHRSLSFGDPVAPVHESARTEAPGVVELWETESPVAEAEIVAWDKPLDEVEAGAPPVRLANRIAATIAGWMRAGDDSGRRVAPGDVLILVRNRNAFFEAVIRALKTAGVPVAGADRLALTQHIAVMDLLAVGRTSLLPDDDLTLATVLKSPFLGLTDADLERIAPHRAGSLAAALEGAAPTDLVFAKAQERLARWRRLAASCGPFSFYATLLGAEGGRRAVLSRLGTEAGDAVDEFLRIALDHEQRECPSLLRFIAAIAEADLVVKRDMDANAGEVRVMTVHGAKGLEAPIVFLADTCTAPDGKHDDPIQMLQGPRGAVPVWAPGKAQDPQPVAVARQAGQDRMREEYHRLLYVAMTRAKDRLVIAGFEGKRGRAKGSWYDMVADAVRPLATEIRDGERTIWRYQTRPFAPAEATAQAGAAPEAPLPPWLTRAAPPEPEPRPPLRPSSASAAADVSLAPPPVAGSSVSTAGRSARSRGILAHALLEILPAQPVERRRPGASAFIRARAPDLTEDERDSLLGDVLAILDDPALAPLFGPHSRAEVPVAGRLSLAPGAAPVPVSGQIDRLAVTDDAVWIADYKTSAAPPAPGADMPEPYVAQLAVYAALVAELFPGRAVRALLVWTRGPVVTEIPAARLAAALAAIKPA
jgi:ATP-dependent helicase/nuclease subunit A